MNSEANAYLPELRLVRLLRANLFCQDRQSGHACFLVPSSRPADLMLDPQKQARIVQDAETFITELYRPCPCFTSVRPHPICGLEQSTARKTGRNRLEVRTAYRQRGGVSPLQLGVQLFWEPLGRCCRLSRNGPTARRQSSICSPASTRQNPVEHTVHPDEETG